ncbi:MAG: flagellar basal body rod protein FlgC [Gemmataceae bacterium]|nr:flagellar basal body rod protein FlgC [Gemmataceae bacterium]MDW8241989.1 flagellar basal body rod protein FlgC [Thermogemmata sp.]
MAYPDMFAAFSVSAAGMMAERYRMEVIANNVANMHTTRTTRGGPYRRLDVVFEEVLREPRRVGEAPSLGGVRVAELVEDPAEPIRVHQPGHPHADANGYVAYPNISLPVEMVNLLTAVRAYEANFRVSQVFRQLNELTLNLMRG